ncbi:EamA family transporter [Maritimibacter sp. 55A14]|uniref:DMT family transporter n=1 Tax=Maritimibacter sp. 55A14 TaxID=2174844 RepID=UPI000D61A20E|nr:DMT family transporter [Maritimibacter sp. 55A14]PWE32128.1 EamA family transporter [Maritimibacter sp. 55A14]
MRLFLLIALTMIAFAANSVLNRLALAEGQIGPAGFGLIRLASGALALAALVWWRHGRPVLLAEVTAVSVAALALYVLGFSYAYVSLDAGLGALLLFGGVQVTMFAGALAMREPVPPRRWLGAALAFGGLVWLFGAPSTGAPLAMALMVAAALGWGVYSLIGRRVADPLAATAANFALATPVALTAVLIRPDALPVTGAGAGLAVISGVVTSGLGYALWYQVLPLIASSMAAVAQLTVPVIAMAGGAVLLGERVTPAMLIAAALVLGGVGLSAFRR